MSTTKTGARARRTPKAALPAADASHTPITGAPLRLDVPALLDKLKLPGFDVAGLLESRNKDLQALLAASEQAWRGAEAVMRRQGEMLAEAMKLVGENTRETLAAKDAKTRVDHIGSHARAAFGRALADLKELAELSARSQQQVVDTLNKRLRDGIGEATRQRTPQP